MAEIWELEANEISSLFREKKISSKEIIDSLEKRFHQTNPKINATRPTNINPMDNLFAFLLISNINYNFILPYYSVRPLAHNKQSSTFLIL